MCQVLLKEDETIHKSKFQLIITYFSCRIHLCAVLMFQSQRGQRELRSIASDPDDANLFNVVDFDSLQNATGRILEAVCNGE